MKGPTRLQIQDGEDDDQARIDEVRALLLKLGADAAAGSESL